MKFKKLTVLALVACLAFTACGKEKESNRGNEEPSAQTSVVTEPSEVQEPSKVQEPSLVTEPSEAQEDPDNTGSSASATSGSSTYLTSGTVGEYTYEIEPDFTAGKKYYEEDLKNHCWIFESLEEVDTPIWVTISSGEKSHGGYGIGVVDITEEDDGTVVITVEETSPSPDQATTDEITTPNVTVRFDYGTNGTPTSIKVVNTEGVEILSLS